MKEPEIRLQEMVAKLKSKNFRLTPQRLAVLKILSVSKDHPSVEKVYEQVKTDFPTTSLATVYKTISSLKEIGEILELGFSDRGNRYDGNKPYPHPHLICTQCGIIIDPYVTPLQKLMKKLSQTTGFTIVSHRLDFYGTCPGCQKKNEKPS